MEKSIVVVFHKDCKPSTDFIIKVSKLQNFSIDYIDVKTDKFESDIIGMEP